ncbi:DUF7940 domain-containing protein [Acinetobacter ursingii]|uniref:DUF7940 domain-containing protein n=1 Tax=Acinetobacter ursingii TaxID=108980 RepID=UPI0021CD8166|nr:hypothetical protein [Acinetobacter ursingii]MCU4481237.1 hypothetical protein [Acinetobacter ursingii]MCU4505566.1 hypothetical protein [Acinetobacter ursingii]MCU4571068.1 hypothetical protein [Acinetobacter ursingii]
MKKTTRKTPQSVKTQRKIDAAVEQVATDKDRFYQGVLSRLENRHSDELNSIANKTAQALVNNSPIVSNWQNSWKWFSNIAFALIVAVQAFYDALPPEVLTALPADTQQTITAVLAVLGILGRFINQSRQKDAGHV